MIGVLTLTLGTVGENLIEEVSTMLGGRPEFIGSLSVKSGQTPESLHQDVGRLIEDLDQGEGVVILADIYGATHTKAACRLLEHGRVELVTGVNLPMLIRVLNYRHLCVEVVAEKAFAGGRTGIVWPSDPASLQEVSG